MVSHGQLWFTMSLQHEDIPQVHESNSCSYAKKWMDAQRQTWLSMNRSPPEQLHTPGTILKTDTSHIRYPHCPQLPLLSRHFLKAPVLMCSLQIWCVSSTSVTAARTLLWPYCKMGKSKRLLPLPASSTFKPGECRWKDVERCGKEKVERLLTPRSCWLHPCSWHTVLWKTQPRPQRRRKRPQ